MNPFKYLRGSLLLPGRALELQKLHLSLDTFGLACKYLHGPAPARGHGREVESAGRHSQQIKVVDKLGQARKARAELSGLRFLAAQLQPYDCPKKSAALWLIRLLRAIFSASSAFTERARRAMLRGVQAGRGRGPGLCQPRSVRSSR